MENIRDLETIVTLIASLGIVIGLMYRFLSYASVNFISIIPVIQNVIAFTIFITILTFYKVINSLNIIDIRLGIVTMLVYFIVAVFAGWRIDVVMNEKKEVVKNETAEKVILKRGYKKSSR